MYQIIAHKIVNVGFFCCLYACSLTSFQWENLATVIGNTRWDTHEIGVEHSAYVDILHPCTCTWFVSFTPFYMFLFTSAMFSQSSYCWKLRPAPSPGTNFN